MEPTEILSSDGAASGIEDETAQPIESISQPFDPEKIDVSTRSMTVDLLLSRINSGAIDLAPDFQRRAGIWTDVRQSRLIESLLLRIPLPTLYAAEDEVETWAMVDGIQRLTTIARFMAPESIRQQRLKLVGLEYLSSEFNGATYDDLPPRLKRRLRETELIVHVIRFGTPDEVKFNVFARINTGGMPLSSQELRHALIPGKAREILGLWAGTDEFVHATDGSIKDDRMADRELVLRFIAFRIAGYDGYSSPDFDDFLRRAMRSLNSLKPDEIRKLRHEFSSSLDAAYHIFGRHCFRKIYRDGAPRYPINKALFDSISVNLAMLGDLERARLIKNSKAVVRDYIQLVNDSGFESSISQGTGNPSKVKYRFSKISELFRRHSL